MYHLPTPKKLSDCLTNTTTQLGQYQKKVHRLLSLNHLWKQQKRIALSLHSTIANCEENMLILAVENSSWASELHYTKQSLLRLFNSWPNLQVTNIKWYITQVESKPLETVALKKATQLSQANRALIKSVASTLPHTGLTLALLKLADH